MPCPYMRQSLGTSKRIHTYFNIMESLSTHIWSLKCTHHTSYLTSYLLMLLLSTLHNSTHTRITHKINMNLVRTLTRKLYVFVATLSLLLMCHFSFIVNATTTKTINFNEWFKSLALFISLIRNIFIKLWI